MPSTFARHAPAMKLEGKSQAGADATLILSKNQHRAIAGEKRPVTLREQVAHVSKASKPRAPS